MLWQIPLTHGEPAPSGREGNWSKKCSVWQRCSASAGPLHRLQKITAKSRPSARFIRQAALTTPMSFHSHFRTATYKWWAPRRRLLKDKAPGYPSPNRACSSIAKRWPALTCAVYLLLIYAELLPRHPLIIATHGERITFGLTWTRGESFGLFVLFLQDKLMPQKGNFITYINQAFSSQ